MGSSIPPTPGLVPPVDNGKNVTFDPVVLVNQIGAFLG